MLWASALERSATTQRRTALLRAGTLQRSATTQRTTAALRAGALERTSPLRRTALGLTCALRDTTLLRTRGLSRIGALQWAGALQRIVSLERIVARWARVLPLTLTLTLVLSLVLLLALLRLRNGGAARKNCESGDDTLRPKCNFQHKTHLTSGKDPGALLVPNSLQTHLAPAGLTADPSKFGRKIPKYSLNSKPAILTYS